MESWRGRPTEGGRWRGRCGEGGLEFWIESGGMWIWGEGSCLRSREEGEGEELHDC